MDTTVWIASFNGIAQVISNLESYANAPGINISNWVTQIIGNAACGYAFTLKATIKGEKPMGIKVAKNYSPVGGHRDCPNYLGLMRSGKFEHPDIELLSMLGYVICGLWLGKPLAIVNSGRGLIIERVIKDLNITDMTVVIHDFSTGGKDPIHDVDLNFNEIKAKAKVYATRSERIKSLPRRSGHSTEGKIDLSKRAKVEVIP